MIKHARGLVLALTTALAAGCGGGAAADNRSDDGAGNGRASGAASGARTDHSRIVVETAGERWTGFRCRPRVVRVFASPTSGRIPTVPTMCVVGVGMTPRLNLEVNGMANYETGRWTGDGIPRRIQVDFEADGHELDTRTDAIDPASTVTISTWDPEGLIEGDLDLALTSAAGRGTIRGPFTIMFEVR